MFSTAFFCLIFSEKTFLRFVSEFPKSCLGLNRFKIFRKISSGSYPRMVLANIFLGEFCLVFGLNITNRIFSSNPNIGVTCNKEINRCTLIENFPPGFSPRISSKNFSDGLARMCLDSSARGIPKSIRIEFNEGIW